MTYKNSILGSLLVPVLVILVVLLSVAVAWLYFSRTPMSTASPPAQQQSLPLQAPASQAAPVPSREVAASVVVAAKRLEVALGKEDRLALSQHGSDGGRVLAGRDLVDSNICTQLNSYQQRQLASDIGSKQLVLNPEKASSLIELLEACQPGIAKYQAPPTVYLSSEDKAALSRAGLGEISKTMVDMPGGLGLESCVVYSKRDIDLLNDYLRLGKLQLSERSRQQLSLLLEHCGR